MASSSKIVKAAVVQAEPEWLDLAGTVRKTCTLIVEAASQGANIVAFPEIWIPGYPLWIWSRSMDFDYNIAFAKSSLVVDSDEMRTIQACAAKNNIVVCLGLSERVGHTTYIGQCTIGSDGKLLMARRKLKPFHMERTVFGDGDGPSLENVVQTSAGKVGQLSCGEHFNPLLNYSTFSQGEEVHVAAWPPVPQHLGGPAPYSMSDDAVAAISRVYAIQASCFVLHSTGIVTEKGIKKMGTEQGFVLSTPGGGNAKIFGPDGRQMTEDLAATEEGMVFADLNLDLIIKEKSIIDTCGHNSRPELLWLGRDVSAKRAVREHGSESKIKPTTKFTVPDKAATET